MKSKFNIGLKLSRNFQTVTCEFVEEELEFESEDELKAKIREKFDIAKNEINLQFEKLKNGA
jgi:hypothetical protein